MALPGYKTVLILLLCVFQMCTAKKNAKTANMNNETLLTDQLLQTYNKLQANMYARPVVNEAEPVKVKFELSLNHIHGLDLETQVLTTSCWLTYEWTDPRLTWKPDEYGGLKNIRYPTSKLWKPDIELFNSAEEYHAYTGGSPLVAISDEGKVFWTQNRKLKSFCSVDTNMSYIFECTFRFSSWIYDGFLLDLDIRSATADLNNYVENKNWRIISFSGTKNTVYYSCCPEPFIDIQYTLLLQRTDIGQRKSNELTDDNKDYFDHVIIIFLPTILLTSLMLMIFCLPADMDSKINLGMFIFIGYMILLLAVTYIYPYNGNHDNSIQFTQIQWFLITMLCLVTITICIAVLSMNIAKKGEAGLVLPECIRKGFNNCLGCLVCIFYNRQRFLKKYSVSDWDKNEQIVANRDWRIFSAVLDRIFFFICLVLVAAAAVIISLYF